MLVLLTAMAVDGIAYLPTFVNAWHNPNHESMSMFVISAVGTSLVVVAAVLAHATSRGLIYPLYSLVFGGIMIGILLSRRQVKLSHDQAPDLAAATTVS
jgi:cation transport ATPase